MFLTDRQHANLSTSTVDRWLLLPLLLGAGLTLTVPAFAQQEADKIVGGPAPTRLPLALSADTFGVENEAAAFSVIANAPTHTAGVSGTLNQKLNRGLVSSRDSVAIYGENSGGALAIAVGVHYDATHVYLPAAQPLPREVLGRLHTGMFIDTNTVPDKMTGIIQSWSVDGSSITVDQWVSVTGTDPAHPPLGHLDPEGKPTVNRLAQIVFISPRDSVWAINTNTDLADVRVTTEAVGYELGITNSSGIFNRRSPDSSVPGGYNPIADSPLVVGILANGYATRPDASSKSAAVPYTANFMSRGYVDKGFLALSGAQAAFMFTPTDMSPDGQLPFPWGYGFYSTQPSNYAFVAEPGGAGKRSFSVDAASGDTVAGRVTASGPVIDGSYGFADVTNGFTYDVPDRSSGVLLDCLGTLAGGTIRLPAHPADRQELTISVGCRIDGVRILPASGQSLTSAPGSLTVESGPSWIFAAERGKWFRLH